MRYYILQECHTGHKVTLRPMTYTESGFDSRHKARHYLDRHGWRFSPRIVREDRISDVQWRFERENN
jgi:hypothetical protein